MPQRMPCASTHGPAPLAPSPSTHSALEALLELMHHQDMRRSVLLSAIESKATSARKNSLSVDNYFQTIERQALGAHKFNNHQARTPRA